MRVVLAEGKRVVREALESLLASSADIEVVGSFGDGVSLVEGAGALRPDVVVAAPHLADEPGTAWIPRVKAASADAKILILSSCENDADLVLSLAAGIDGYLCTDCSSEDLVAAIREVCTELFPLSASVARQMRDLAVMPRDGSSLTTRELEVLLALGEGLTTHEIAARLLLSHSTVKTHLGKIYKKLGVRNRVEAVRVAAETHLIATP